MRVVASVINRGLVGEIKRCGGGLAPALGRDESATAGAALDHVVATGDLKEVGRRFVELSERRLRLHEQEEEATLKHEY